jgi:hypothetical protein
MTGYYLIKAEKKSIYIQGVIAMNLPNFLIIGAAKSGTTTLYNSLKQHPDIYFSPLKEPHFFSHGLSGDTQVAVERYGKYQSPITDLDTYKSLFDDVSDEIAIGEASTSYLIHPDAAERIKQHIPDAKLIAILRNPVDRAYSAFLMKYRIQKKDMTDSQKLLEDFKEEVKQAYGENNTGLYHRKIQKYLEFFDESQLKVIAFKKFQVDFEPVIQDIFSFLNVKPDVSVEKPSVRNKGGVPKNKLVFNTLEQLRQGFNSTVRPLIPEPLVDRMYNSYTMMRNRTLDKPPELLPEVRHDLLMFYRDDILQLQEMLKQDFSMWLE